MSWSFYRWVWRLESPLHIGMPPAGILNRTRLYVPARALWGALVAEIARCQTDGFPDYADVGQCLRENARFSYLYPAEETDQGWLAWLPIFREGIGLGWLREDMREDHERILSDREFRRRLLYTRPGTAIDHGTSTAAEGTLRETECVQPLWRDERGDFCKQVAYVGYIFVRDNALEEELRLVTEIFVGGDTRYGLGRLVLSGTWEQAHNCFGAQVDLDESHPIIHTKHLLAHAEADQGQIIGAWEMIAGWDLTKSDRLVVINPDPLWAPGSVCQHPMKFRIDEMGIWRADI